MDYVTPPPDSEWLSEGGLDDQIPFPVYEVAEWRGPRYVAFYASRGGRLREISLGCGVRWSADPWLEVTSFSPESTRNDPRELSQIAAHRVEEVINDYAIRGAPLGGDNLQPSDSHLTGCTISGEWHPFETMHKRLTVASASVATAEGRGIVLTWNRQDKPILPSLALTTFIGSYRQSRSS